MSVDCSPENVQQLLAAARDGSQRSQVAAALSKVAAKAEDDILLMLSTEAATFVSWLIDPTTEPLVRAYTACIVANIAFLEGGQRRVLEAGGVGPLVAMLRSKEDRKVTLHSTAAVQNLTYKNTECCQVVLEEGGEKALKKLLQHKSEDVQQFAAGAIANLQLYRKKESEEHGKGGGSMMSRKVAKILRRKPAKGSEGSPGGLGSNNLSNGSFLQTWQEQRTDLAAAKIQACFRSKKVRTELNQKRQQASRKKGNKYDKFNMKDVRAELSAMPEPAMGGGGLGRLPGMAGGGLGMGGGGLGMGGGGLGTGFARLGLGGGLGGGLSGGISGGMRPPARLAPINANRMPLAPIGGGSSIGGAMPSLPGPPGGHLVGGLPGR